MKHSKNTTQGHDALFIRRVLSMYRAQGRHDLSWRKKITPYGILVSEIMLQQTQVSRVLPKYASWMKTFPTLSKLSKAKLSDVLKLWQGLGYQRRAKALHDIAKQTKTLPQIYDELLALPGIGPYTASAIMAFAYDAFPPHLLETNIRTALIEQFHLPAQAGQGETGVRDDVLYDDLARLANNTTVRKVGARTWYYALMDYGAHLKSIRISHNEKSAHHAKQSPYEGSLRQLRAKTLFAITHGNALPTDERTKSVVEQLIKEEYVVRTGSCYRIQ